MVRSLRLISLCLLTSVPYLLGQLVGDGVDNDFCGDTGLGFRGALLDAVKGHGFIEYEGVNGAGNVSTRIIIRSMVIIIM